MATDEEPEEGKKALTLKRTTSLASDYVRKLREELTQVGERVDFITSQIDNIEAATPELDRKLHYARIGRPLTSLSIESLLQLKLINRKLLQFWVDLNKKQLEKLDFLAESMSLFPLTYQVFSNDLIILSLIILIEITASSLCQNFVSIELWITINGHKFQSHIFQLWARFSRCA